MRRLSITVLATVITGSAFAGVGIGSELYLTAGDQATIWVVQGTGVNRSWATAGTGREYPIAVGNEVRTLGGTPGEVGAEYSLAGVSSGTTYNFPAAIGSAWDGTTDMSSNYVMDYSGGAVYRTDRAWANETLLFNVGTFGERLGITYDFTDNTLWLSGWNQGFVEHRMMDGTLLGSWATPFNSISCLALDHVTNTLWMGSQTTQGTFYQYAKDGTAMGSVFIQDLATQNTLGGEFQAVPEPATFVVVGIGLLALIRRRR